MFRAPGHTPPLGYLLDALPTRDSRQISRHLGITARTLARWIAAGQAPRVAMLALFWETPWGASVANCSAVNGQAVYMNLAQSLERENSQLRTRIARLEETGDFGAANSPLYAR